ncbi:Tetratricopeptide repeat-containing protein [Burkholderia sp. D7]|nr:Tetratricopeptide repeat-containing protein [Burkholderia sp. D7]
MAVFGSDVIEDPAIGAVVRSLLYFNQGNVSLKAKNYLGAIRSYSRALDMHKTSDAFNNRGLAYWHLGDTAKAVQDFESALQSERRDVHAWMNRGNLLLALKRYDEAIDSFSHAIDNGTHKADVYISRGNAYRAKGDARSALFDYDAAIAREPSDPRAHFGRGAALYYDGNLDGAATEFKAALGLAPPTQTRCEA